MTRTIVDVHVIQTVPPSNLNRDDTGSPKSAVYGGVRRARVSSQAWKRATRRDFERHLDRRDLGVRTKRVVELIGDAVAHQAGDLAEQRVEIASAVLKAGGIKLAKPRKGEIEESGYLIFLSRRQVDALAALGVDAARRGDLASIDKASVKRVFKAENSIDVALFGRMVADDTDLNVDASAQVAHALSVHAVDTEYDYFTAVDDHKADDAEEDAGAGMIGTVEFNSSTLYRYATVDVDALQDNLGSVEATRKAVGAFVRSFVTSMPTGKQNTFANRTLPDAVMVSLRSDQPVSLVGAFEEAVVDGHGMGRIRAAAEQMATYATDLEGAFGSAPVKTWIVGVGDRVVALEKLGDPTTFDQLVSDLERSVADRLTVPQ